MLITDNTFEEKEYIDKHLKMIADYSKGFITEDEFYTFIRLILEAVLAHGKIIGSEEAVNFQDKLRKAEESLRQ